MNRTDAAEGQAVEALTIDQRDEVQKQRDDDILRHVQEDLNASITDREEREPQWDRYSAMYNCHLEASRYPWKSKVYDPEPFAAIETINPRIINTLLGGPEVFGIKPTGQDDVQKARKSKMLLDYQSDRMDLYTKLGDISKDGLIYGTSFGKLRWRKDFEPRITYHPVLDGLGMPVPDPMTGQVAMKPEKEFVKVYDDPDLERVDVKDLYADPAASCLDDARYVIHRLRRTRDYLKKKEAEGIYRNVDLIPKGDNSATNDQSSDSRRIVNMQSNDPSTIALHDEQMEEVTLHEYYGLYDIDGDGYLEDCVITIANNAIVIRAEYNPFPGGFKPFVRFTPIPIPGSFYGMSLLRPIEGISDALNDRTNQIGDNVNLVLNPMFLYNRNADVDPDEFVSSPGGAIAVNDVDRDVRRFDMGDIASSVFPEISRLEGKIQKALGTYDYAAGGAPQRQEAATTVISLQQVAEIRFKTIAIYFERQIIRPLGNMLLKLNKRMMDGQRQVRILGREAQQPFAPPEFEQMGPEDVVENADIYAVGAAIDPSVSKQMQLDSLMKFMSIVAGNPQLMMSPMWGIDWSVVIEELPYLLDLKLKRPLVLPTNPELAYQELKQDESMADQMLMGQMQMMQGAAMGGMGGPPPGESVPDKNAREAPSRTKGETAKRKSGVRGKKPKEEKNGGGSKG